MLSAILLTVIVLMTAAAVVTVAVVIPYITARDDAESLAAHRAEEIAERSAAAGIPPRGARDY